MKQLFNIIFLLTLAYADVLFDVTCLDSTAVFYPHSRFTFKCNENMSNFELVKKHWNKWLNLVYTGSKLNQRYKELQDQMSNIESSERSLSEFAKSYRDTPYCCRVNESVGNCFVHLNRGKVYGLQFG